MEIKVDGLLVGILCTCSPWLPLGASPPCCTPWQAWRCCSHAAKASLGRPWRVGHTGDTGRWGHGEAGERGRASTEGLAVDGRGRGCWWLWRCRGGGEEALDPFCASPFRPSVHLRKEKERARVNEALFSSKKFCKIF